MSWYYTNIFSGVYGSDITLGHSAMVTFGVVCMEVTRRTVWAWFYCKNILCCSGLVYHNNAVQIVLSWYYSNILYDVCGSDIALCHSTTGSY